MIEEKLDLLEKIDTHGSKITKKSEDKFTLPNQIDISKIKIMDQNDVKDVAPIREMK